VALKVLRVVGARLRRLIGIIEELSFATVRHRLASFLFRLSQKEGKRSGTGIEITLPIAIRNWPSRLAPSVSSFLATFPAYKQKECLRSTAAR
jgi:CRP-like cAMP-binding protein